MFELSVKVQGLDDLRAALLGLAPKLRRRALRDALAAGARVYRDAARRLAPVLAAPIVRRGQVARKPGTLRKAIVIRTSRLARQRGDVGVFINVRPAKGARFKTIKNKRVQTRASQRGRYSPNDPYYWRFVEFGTVRMPAKPYLRPAASGNEAEALRRIEQTLGPQIRKLNVKGGGPL